MHYRMMIVLRMLASLAALFVLPVWARLGGFAGSNAAATTGTIYDGSRAVLFAKLASAAYCAKAKLDNSWSCGPACIDGVNNTKVCQGSATQAIVGIWEGKPFLSF